MIDVEEDVEEEEEEEEEDKLKKRGTDIHISTERVCQEPEPEPESKPSKRQVVIVMPEKHY